MEVGQAIRRIRRSKNLTIDDLTATTGLSRAYISQIENNKASPSISTIKKICAGLDIAPSLLFEDTEANCVVIRANRRQVLNFETHQEGRIFTKVVHLLSEPNRKLEFAMMELSPGHTAGDHSHPGEEIFYVIEGTITLTYGEDEHVLGPGDSAHIESQRTHKIYNNGPGTARLMSARTPPGFIDLKHDETVRRGNA